MNVLDHLTKSPVGLRALLAALGLAGSSGLALAAGSAFTLDTFDTSDLGPWKGLDHSVIQYVTSQDAGGTASQGALQIHLVNTAPSDWQAAQAQRDLWSQEFNTSNYWSVSFDLKVDPSSCPGNSTAYGNVAVVPIGNGWTWLDKLCWIPTTPDFTNWQHLEVTFPQPYANLNAFVFQINDNHFTNDVIFYVDNIKVNPVPFSTVLDQFTNSAEAVGWTWQSWSQPGTPAWVASPDAGGATPTGSLRLDCDFNNPTPPAWQQVVFQKDFKADPNRFANLEMDVMVDPSSSPMGNGALPAFEAILNANGDYGWIHLGQKPLPAPGAGWAHLTFPLAAPLAAAPAVTNLNSVILWVGGGSDGNYGPTNRVRLYVDNIKFAQTRPGLALEDNTSPAGLQIGCTPTGSAWQRQGIVTPSSTRNYTWVGRSTPVTYSFTITNFPSPSDCPGFEAHLWMMNYDTLVNQSWDEIWSEVDYNAADLVYLKLRNSGTGVEFSFSYKTASANSTTFTWLDSIYGETALGRWDVTFNLDSTVTLAGPNGIADTFYLDPAIAASFPGQMSLNFGVAKNGTTANDNAAATFSRIDVTGVPNPIAETFSGAALNPNPAQPAWRLALSDGTGLRFIPAGTAKWITWSLPDAGFSLQSASSLNGPWNPVTPPYTYQGVAAKSVPLSADSLGTGSTFFRLARTAQ